MLDLPERFTFEGHTIRWGRMGSGPALVLLHGTPFSSYEWHRIAPILARQRTVYFHDMLGYGRSDMPEGADVSLNVQNRILQRCSATGACRSPTSSRMISAARRRCARI